MRQPEEQLVAVQILDDQRRPAPIIASGLDALPDDVLAYLRTLSVLHADKDPSMASPCVARVIRLIEDQLEAEQADLTHYSQALLAGVPILREAEFLRVDAQRAFSICHEEDG